ncbi:MAG TPA: hypothetical protein VM864_07015 [Pyrinomonadaceae bacterium]|jgi:hypothetical protein|nr:hypothetical protein [Pyrinomonadaceae bacterium]
MKNNGRRKPRRSFKLHSHVAPSGNTEDLAAKLAPLEEREGGGAQAGAVKNNGGSIVVDTGALKLPEGLVAEREKNKLLLGFEPVVLFIIVLSLAFIAFIAWQISQMPTTAD